MHPEQEPAGRRGPAIPLPLSGEPTTAERDPVCGMMVNPKDAPASTVHGSRRYSFCCIHCQHRFEADPARYIGGGATAAPAEPPAGGVYTCPMHPEVRQDHPGACPSCGMSLEPEVPAAPTTRVEYTCPMHPEVVRDGPGSCPVCGMALEPRTITVEDEPNPELADMSRRLWVGVLFSVPVFLIAMSDMVPGRPLHRYMTALNWVQLALSTPVVLWAGWPFFQRAWASVRNRSPNMFTLIALGVGAASVYSLAATVAPGLFPAGSACRPGRSRPTSIRRPS